VTLDRVPDDVRVVPDTSDAGTVPGAFPAYHALAKPTGSVCNLDCEYCYFLSKQALYPGDRSRMSDDLLEAYLRQLLGSHRTPDVTVAWQGGEPTMMGLDFFRRSVRLVEELKSPRQRVQHTIQTNGLLLDDRWAEFFGAHGFLVGLSVDGPRELHDRYRVDMRGAGSFDRVMAGYEHLRAAGVDVNVLCTVHAGNQDHPLEVYRFFRDEMGVRFIQFIPIVEPTTGATPRISDRSVDPETFGTFLTTIFDEWVRRDVGEVFVQHFDAALANWYGAPPCVCVFSETCGGAVAIEHNGDVYSCDHFVEPEHLLGNITVTPLGDLVRSARQVRFGADKRDVLPGSCRRCDVRFACHGGCPKDRVATTSDGEPGLNYLCAGYRHFFGHIDGPMRMMCDLLRAGRAPAELPTLLAVGRVGRP
jgi:serine-type anaerobic sulfatase-maturating enzyme